VTRPAPRWRWCASSGVCGNDRSMRAGSKTGAKETRKANKRGAARLAAAQALYQMDLAGTA
jgi:hypothetical protein